MCSTLYVIDTYFQVCRAVNYLLNISHYGFENGSALALYFSHKYLVTRLPTAVSAFSVGATEIEIRSAYKTIALIFQPDKFTEEITNK
jgi:hypothetical protein